MMGWNFNMDEAPKGRYRTVTRNMKGQDIETQVFVPEPIFAAASDGETVTISKWMPKEERWNMFTKDTPPIAWMPFPKHPGIKQKRSVEDLI